MKRHIICDYDIYFLNDSDFFIYINYCFNGGHFGYFGI